MSLSIRMNNLLGIGGNEFKIEEHSSEIKVFLILLNSLRRVLRGQLRLAMYVISLQRFTP